MTTTQNQMLFYTYDLETYPNIFTFAGENVQTGEIKVFEISDRRNDRDALRMHLDHLSRYGYYLVGYNNLGFDYPIIHDLLTNPYAFTYQRAAQLANEIIFGNNAQYGREQIYFTNRMLKQIDLMKINHFDNAAKRTPLKTLQFNMRSQTVEDLPFDLRPLTHEEKDVLIKYNIHDVTETTQFLKYCMHMITMRKELYDSGALSGDVLNFNDTKIGEQYLIKQIGREKCYENKKAKQTIRPYVKIEHIILPKIHFMDEDYGQVLEWFKTVTWYPQGEQFKADYKLRDTHYFFGVGGIHASVENKRYVANDEWEIIDVDVESYYPSSAMVNGFEPEHLQGFFLGPYRSLKERRLNYKKGTPMNAMFKLALNGAYGKSNDDFSALKDPKFMLSITVNCQLQLLQLCEAFSSIPRVQIIQANTDGVTCYVHKSVKPLFNFYKDWWQRETGYKLEQVNYSKMFIRDVNNYIAVSTEGKIKRKGTYWYPEKIEDYDGNWHKDLSMMVVQKAACMCMLEGVTPEYAIQQFKDPFDFMKRHKTASGSKTFIGDVPQQRTVRYYVSRIGDPMRTESKPTGVEGTYKRKNGITDSYYAKVLAEIAPGAWDERIHTKNKSVYTTVVRSIEAGSLVKQCNNAKDFDWNDVDYDYYIKEINKLII